MKKKNKVKGYIIHDPSNKEFYINNDAELRSFCIENNIVLSSLLTSRKFRNYRLMSIIPEEITSEMVNKAGKGYEIEKVDYTEKADGRLQSYSSELYYITDEKFNEFCEEKGIDTDDLFSKGSDICYRLLYKHEGQSLVTVLSPTGEVIFFINRAKDFFSRLGINYNYLKERLEYKGWELLNIEKYDDVLQRRLHRTSDELLSFYSYCKKEGINLPKFENRYGRFYQKLRF